MADRTAILLDGGFVKKKLHKHLSRFPSPNDVVKVTQDIMGHVRLRESSLFRVYYYDARPFEGNTKNPINQSPLNFSNTPQAKQNRALIDSLELQPDFAVRLGTILQSGWKLGSSALRSLSAKPRSITPNDLVPDMGQRGVDLRIGLDIALLSLKRIVETIVLVTGDSDLIPAMKMSRKEGLKVYLETLGHPVRRELKVHADLVLKSTAML